MSRETHNQETGNTLSRWWWPGQWLHIVYGVWVDQGWYWQNVRPQLSDWKRGWGILVQGILGTVLVVSILSVIMGGIFLVAGVQVNWSKWARNGPWIVAAALVGALVLAIAGAVSEGSVSDGMAFGTLFGVVFGAAGGMVSSVSSEVFWGLVLGAAIGGGLSMVIGVDTGVRFGVWFDLVVATGTGVAFGIKFGVAAGIAAGVASGLSCYLGGWWATRQVPDAETRKRLANPDRHLSRY